MGTTLHLRPVALVVDDDDQSSEVLRRFLVAEGFAVVSSMSAEDAMLVAPKHRFDLILLDIQMYGMNGWQFLDQLHVRDMQSKVPVIITSGRPIEDDVVQKRGAVAALQKPIRLVDLKAILARLGLPRAGGAPAA